MICNGAACSRKTIPPLARNAATLQHRYLLACHAWNPLTHPSARCYPSCSLCAPACTHCVNPYFLLVPPSCRAASSGDRSPALAPLLTLLGYTYSRSARVTFAEGLFREAAKLLRLDPGRQQPPPDGPAARAAAAGAGVHASAAAVLAWRYAQLLWVLPNRGGCWGAVGPRE